MFKGSQYGTKILRWVLDFWIFVDLSHKQHADNMIGMQNSCFKEML